MAGPNFDNPNRFYLEKKTSTEVRNLGKKEAILALLNDSFRKEEFPFICNSNFDFAKGKLSV